MASYQMLYSITSIKYALITYFHLPYCRVECFRAFNINRSCINSVGIYIIVASCINVL